MINLKTKGYSIMQVEISLSMSTGNGKNKFKVTENLEQPDENKLSAMCDMLQETVRTYLGHIEGKSLIELAPYEKIVWKPSKEMLRMLRQILKKHHIPEQEVCTKYHIQQLEELSGENASQLLQEIIAADKEKTDPAATPND